MSKRTVVILLIIGGLSCGLRGFAWPQQVAIKGREAVQLQEKPVALACSVAGTVRDTAGAVIPGAAVQVIETANGAPHALTSDKAGRYCALGLPAGQYSVVVDKPGFRSTRLDAVTVAAGHSALADVVLLPLSRPVFHHGTIPQPIAPKSGPGPAPQPVPKPVQQPVAPVVSPPPSPPTPVPTPTPTPEATPEAPVAQPVQPQAAQEDLGEAEAKWFDQLKKGSIQYQVPEQMIIGQASSVSVTINGYKVPVPQAQPDGSTPAPLKVSEFMRVDISQVDNPGAFTIVHGSNPDQQFVPINSSATWTWAVTPNHLGKGQKLQFQAFVVYSDPKLNVQQALASAEKTVTVRAEGVSGIARAAADNFWLNPANWVKYMLPGGGGFLILGLLIGWLRKKQAKAGPEKASPDKPGSK